MENDKLIGYVSLAQFCPNHGRKEGLNIGMLLFIPSCNYLSFTRASLNYLNRIDDAFYSLGYEGNFDADWVASVADSMMYRVVGLEKSLEIIENFIATGANQIVLTPLMPVKVEGPNDLHDLFSRLVEKTDHAIALIG